MNHVQASPTVGNGLPRRDRGDIPIQCQWDLTDLFPDNASWKNTKTEVSQSIQSFSSYAGKLSCGATELLKCLELMSRISCQLRQLGSYASMSSDVDTRDAEKMGMKQEMGPLYAEFESAASFVEPEILQVGKDKIESYIQQESGLSPYHHYFHDLFRRAPHTLSPREEKIVADAGLMMDGPSTIFNIFSNAEFPYPEIEMSSGNRVLLDPASFSYYRVVSPRPDRETIFNAFLGRLHEYRRTFGAQLYASTNTHLFQMKARHYSSTLESALNSNNIPPAVYHNLIARVNCHLSTFHRYLTLRSKLLGLDQLHYYDLYAPLVPGIDLRYSFEEAQKTVLSSLVPLGEDYRFVIQKAFTERWIDVYPSPGKRSGAYSNGSAYDVHPFILMNYNGLFSDLSTLTHELGHTLHSYFSNKTQPFPTADYSIFVAEVASTFNESLLIEHLLGTIADRKIRLSLLGHYLEGFKGTLFRQTQFAEFELQFHQLVEKGEALTGDMLCDLYQSLTRKYYGHSEGICVVDEPVQAEWCFIPHFYYNYYVYQYATAFTASSVLAGQVLAGDSRTLSRYLMFLSSGGIDYPIDLLKRAGVDLTTSYPFELALKKMNRIMDEIEELSTP
jgi:oligoendopeptidase F